MKSSLQIVAAVVAGLCLAGGSGSVAPRDSTPPTFRGMTVSCPTWGWEWGSDAMVESMAHLKTLGVDSVAIHPYASVRDDGTLVVRGQDPADPPDWITRPIEEAHRLGMTLMIKPHIAYWGSSFSWRGEVDFPGPEQLDRFFTGYHAWMVDMAQMAGDADVLVVGTELDRITHHEERWRALIKDVRAHYAGPITYAANWDSYEATPFWDALDYVGIQGYFPVLPDGVDPTDDALAAGWQGIAGSLARFSSKAGKPVLLTELGYNRSARAPYEPWVYRQGGTGAEDIQQRTLAVALRAIDAEPRIAGAYLWKWFPGELQRGDFLLSEDRLQDVIKAGWATPSAPAP